MNEKDSFWREYMAAVKADESRVEFAKRMGTTAQRVWQKVYDKQRQGWDIPQLRTERARVNNSVFRQVMEEFGVIRKSKQNGKPAQPAPKKRASKPEPVREEPEEEGDDDIEQSIEDLVAKLR